MEPDFATPSGRASSAAPQPAPMPEVGPEPGEDSVTAPSLQPAPAPDAGPAPAPEVSPAPEPESGPAQPVPPSPAPQEEKPVYGPAPRPARENPLRHLFDSAVVNQAFEEFRRTAEPKVVQAFAKAVLARAEATENGVDLTTEPLDPIVKAALDSFSNHLTAAKWGVRLPSAAEPPADQPAAPAEPAAPPTKKTNAKSCASGTKRGSHASKVALAETMLERMSLPDLRVLAAHVSMDLTGLVEKKEVVHELAQMTARGLANVSEGTMAHIYASGTFTADDDDTMPISIAAELLTSPPGAKLSKAAEEERAKQMARIPAVRPAPHQDESLTIDFSACNPNAIQTLVRGALPKRYGGTMLDDEASGAASSAAQAETANTIDGGYRISFPKLTPQALARLQDPACVGYEREIYETYANFRQEVKRRGLEPDDLGRLKDQFEDLRERVEAQHNTAQSKLRLAKRLAVDLPPERGLALVTEAGAKVQEAVAAGDAHHIVRHLFEKCIARAKNWLEERNELKTLSSSGDYEEIPDYSPPFSGERAPVLGIIEPFPPDAMPSRTPHKGTTEAVWEFEKLYDEMYSLCVTGRWCVAHGWLFVCQLQREKSAMQKSAPSRERVWRAAAFNRVVRNWRGSLACQEIELHSSFVVKYRKFLIAPQRPEVPGGAELLETIMKSLCGDSPRLPDCPRVPLDELPPPPKAEEVLAGGSTSTPGSASSSAASSSDTPPLSSTEAEVRTSSESGATADADLQGSFVQVHEAHVVAANEATRSSSLLEGAAWEGQHAAPYGAGVALQPLDAIDATPPAPGMLSLLDPTFGAVAFGGDHAVEADYDGLCVCCIEDQATQVAGLCGHLVYCDDCKREAIAAVLNPRPSPKQAARQAKRRMPTKKELVSTRVNCPLCRRETCLVPQERYRGTIFRA